MSARRAGYLLLAALAGACRPAPPQSSTEGHLDVTWKGRDPGGISGPAAATWCASRRVVEIQAVRGDTGLALALYPGKSLGSGVYRVLEPAQAESLPPAAGVAVRWLGSNLVQGFRGDSGRVELQRSRSGRLSGRLSARARSVVDTGRIQLTGTFRDVPVRPDSLGCELEDPDEDAEAGDTGIH